MNRVRNMKESKPRPADAGSPLERQRRLLKALAERGPSPLYIIYGEEGYLVEDTARRIVDAVLPAQQREFSLEVLSGAETTVSQLREALGAMPLFGEARVVWLRGCGIFSSGAKAEAVAGQKIGEGGKTVVIITEEKADRRFSLYREAEKLGSACEFARLSEKGAGLECISRLVTEKLKKDGCGISRDTLFYLVQLVGTDLRIILAETEKLALHAGGSKTIQREDIDLLVSPQRETEAYRLADAIAAGEARNAVSLLKEDLARGVKPGAILEAIIRRMRYLLQARELMDRGIIDISPRKSGYPAFSRSLASIPVHVREALGDSKQHKRYNLLAQHPYAVYLLCMSAERMPVRRLRFNLDLAVRTDGDVKGGRRSKAEALEDLVLALSSRARLIFSET